jgi:hypothetical protein
MGAKRQVALTAILSSSVNSKENRMASSGMLRRVALVRTYVSEKRSASIIRVSRIGELGTALAD